MLNSFKKILVLAPHADDGELGCGGTLAKLSQVEAEIHYVAFSLSRESEPPYRQDILGTELLAATSKLSIKSENVKVLDFPVRKFNFHRQEILEEMINIRKSIQPELVFIPNLNDIHQDHEVIAREGLRAFKHSTILAYELLWNNIDIKLTSFCAIEEEHLEAKIEALNCYKSQQVKGSPYLADDFLRSIARVRGVQIGKQYAEAFEVVRWVM